MRAPAQYRGSLPLERRNVWHRVVIATQSRAQLAGTFSVIVGQDNFGAAIVIDSVTHQFVHPVLFLICKRQAA